LTNLGSITELDLLRLTAGALGLSDGDLDQLSKFAPRNDRIRTEGTRNLLAAAKAAGARHFLAQSIAWRPSGRGEIVDRHELRVRRKLMREFDEWLGVSGAAGSPDNTGSI
jgi:hypothetical protein